VGGTWRGEKERENVALGKSTFEKGGRTVIFTLASLISLETPVITIPPSPHQALLRGEAPEPLEFTYLPAAVLPPPPTAKALLAGASASSSAFPSGSPPGSPSASSSSSSSSSTSLSLASPAATAALLLSVPPANFGAHPTVAVGRVSASGDSSLAAASAAHAAAMRRKDAATAPYSLATIFRPRRLRGGSSGGGSSRSSGSSGSIGSGGGGDDDEYERFDDDDDDDDDSFRPEAPVAPWVREPLGSHDGETKYTEYNSTELRAVSPFALYNV